MYLIQCIYAISGNVLFGTLTLLLPKEPEELDRDLLDLLCLVDIEI